MKQKPIKRKKDGDEEGEIEIKKKRGSLKDKDESANADTPGKLEQVNLILFLINAS